MPYSFYGYSHSTGVVLMAICQLMIKDFMKGTGRFDGGAELYSNRDLREGITYAARLIEEGYSKEPFHHYNLAAFIKWAKKQVG